MHGCSNRPNDQMDQEYASYQRNIHRNSRDFLGFCDDVTLMTSLLCRYLNGVTYMMSPS